MSRLTSTDNDDVIRRIVMIHPERSGVQKPF